MFDFGFAELFVIITLTVLFVGPKDIPKVMKTLGRLVRRLQYVRYAFTQQFEEFMRENDLEDIRSQVNFEEQARPPVFNESEADEDLEYITQNNPEDPSAQDRDQQKDPPDTTPGKNKQKDGGANV